MPSSCEVKQECKSKDMCPSHEPSVVKVCSARHSILAQKGKVKHNEDPEKIAEPVEQGVSQETSPSRTLP